MIPFEVYSRVVKLTVSDGERGTGFLVDRGGQQYLVTARHLCTGEPEDELEVHWAFGEAGVRDQRLTLSRCGDLMHPADVAVFHVPDRIPTQAIDVPLSTEGLFITQDAFILGYPYGLSFQFGDEDGPQHLPLTRRALVSAEQRGVGFSTWILDATANPGFSGGPVVFARAGTRDFAFAGVVVQNVTAPLSPGGPLANAGFCMAVTAPSVVELLDQEPRSR